MTELGTFLKERRRSLNKKQREVSEALGYDQNQSISNWERGVVRPPARKLRAYAKELKTSYKSIVDILVADYKKELNKRVKSSKNTLIVGQ